MITEIRIVVVKGRGGGGIAQKQEIISRVKGMMGDRQRKG